VLEVCVEAGVAIIVQAANTGLTGGSTPDGSYGRDVVIISTLRLRRIRTLRDGHQVLCEAGATLHQLERLLAPLGREPHSVIGSSCMGASVVGGICNNSGGALIQRGPAYTEMALFAQLNHERKLELVNHLGLDLGATPEQILSRLDSPDFDPENLIVSDRAGSDGGYAHAIRAIDADTPARFNADPTRLFETSGSAGKVAVFAVRLDTFAREASPWTIYVGTNNPDDLTVLRRAMLSSSGSLPVSAEYLHAEAFDLADRFGKDMFLAIDKLGTDRLPAFARLQRGFDAMALRAHGSLRYASDRVLQRVARMLPDHLPPRMRSFRKRFSHHLLLKVGGEELNAALASLRATVGSRGGDYFVCTPREAQKAFLHRFVTAGAAIRYSRLHADQIEDVLALDVALRRNDSEWFEALPPELERHILHKVYYGHFFCHVFHRDYLVRKGADVGALKQAMLEWLDERGAEYPAEHNVGHLYSAKPALAAHYQRLDPLNRFNPGIGKLPKGDRWTGAGEALNSGLPRGLLEYVDRKNEASREPR
jgi:D-lactate dehydrogenase